MNSTATVMEALGWTLVHFVWEGAAIAACLWLVMRGLAKAAPVWRYAAATMAMSGMLMAVEATLWWHWPAGRGPTAAAARTDVPTVAGTPTDRREAAGGVDPIGGESVLAGAPRMGGRPAMTGPALPDGPPGRKLTMAGAAAESLRPWLPWIVSGWAVGVVVVLARLGHGWWWVRRVRRTSVAAPVGRWGDRISEIARSLRVSRPVRLLSSATARVPMVIGWLKPVVIVPAALLAGLPTTQLEAILAHELAHIRRNDYVVNWLQCLVEALLFYHPAVWWVSSQIRTEREHCCDDVAARLCGGALPYAKALTALEEWRGVEPLLGLAASGRALLPRIRRLLGVRETATVGGSAAATLLALALVPLGLVFGGASSPVTSSESLAAESLAATRLVMASAADAHATATPCKWTFPGGATLRLYGELIHATDVMTTALISWPAQDARPAVQWHTSIASDAFANREKWAVGWEKEKPVLWVAIRSLGSAEESSDGRPIANRLKRIDFSDPSHIREDYFQHGWPDIDGPAASVMAQMAPIIEVRGGGQLASTLHSWASAGAAEKVDLSAVQNIHLTVQQDGGIVIDIMELRRTCRPEALAETLAALRAEWTAKRGASLAGKSMVPRVTVSAPPETSPDAIEQIRAACVEAGCGPLVSRSVGEAGGMRQIRATQFAMGPPRADGLRVAWALSPRRAEYQIGEIVKGAVWFYNDGPAAITFTTDAWHQFDTWNATRADGSKVEVRSTWFTGLTPQETITLQPGETREIPAHGVGIGNAEFAEHYGRAELGAELWADPGDEVTCVWDVAVSPSGTERLTTGPVTFRVAPAPPEGPRPPIVTDRLGSYNLGHGAILNLSQIGSAEGYTNYAWITWEKARGAAADGKADIAMPRSADPKDYSLPTFVLSRSMPALWIIESEKIRKIDFSTLGEAKESAWPRDQAPADFDGAPEDVREAILKVVAPEEARNGFSIRLVSDTAGPTTERLPEKTVAGEEARFLHVEKQVVISSVDVASAAVEEPEAGGDHWSIRVELTPEAGRRFEVFTGQQVGRRLAIVVDGVVLMAPTVRDRIGRSIAISGNFTESEAKRLVEAIKPSSEAGPVTTPGPETSEPDAPGAATPAHRLRVLEIQGVSPVRQFRVLAGVPSGVSSEFEKAHGVEVITWQPHTIREGKDGELLWPLDRSYEVMALRVEADGFVPQVISGLKKAEGAQDLTIQMVDDAGVRGRVMTPENRRPAHDATVVLAMIGRGARLQGTTFPEVRVKADQASPREAWERPLVVTPDGNGAFSLPTEIDPTAVVLILHGDGVLEMPYAAWKAQPDVTLQPWGRIHGRVKWGGGAGRGEKVALSANHGDLYGYPDILSQSDEMIANDDGVFVFQRVLPGPCQLSCPITPDPGNAAGFTAINLTGRLTHATVAPGPAITPVVVGGVGRTVAGRLSGRASYNDVTLRLHPTAPHVGLPGDDEIWKAWSAFQTSAEGDLFFRDGLKLAADGTFQIPAVLPGSYQLFFEAPGADSWVASFPFVVPPEHRDHPPEPMDLGEIKARR